MRQQGKPRWSSEDQPIANRMMAIVVCVYTTGLLLTGGIVYLKGTFGDAPGVGMAAQARLLRCAPSESSPGLCEQSTGHGLRYGCRTASPL